MNLDPSLEERLRVDLARAADEAPRPEVHLPGLERLGRREQVRRRTAWAALGAAAAVVVLAGAVSAPRLTGAAPEPVAPTPSPPVAPERPVSLDDLPVGDPSNLPWWQAGILHQSGHEISTPYRQLVTAGGTTLVGRSGEDGARWFVLDGERGLVPLVSSEGRLQPVLSGDGSTAVWTEATGETTRHLVAYDIASGTEIGSEDVTVQPVCCDAGGELFVFGVDTDGRVVYDIFGEGAHVWTPGGADVPVTGVPGGQLVYPTWPGGVSWQGRSGDPFGGTPGVYATVDESGAVRRRGTVPTDQLGTWNGDGTAYAYPGQDDGDSAPKVPMTGIWVDHLDSGERTRLLLPADRRFEIVGWESESSVVLQTRNPYGEPVPAGEGPGLVALVRCDVGSGACERTDDDVSGNVALPASR